MTEYADKKMQNKLTVRPKALSTLATRRFRRL